MFDVLSYSPSLSLLVPWFLVLAIPGSMGPSSWVRCARRAMIEQLRHRPNRRYPPHGRFPREVRSGERSGREGVYGGQGGVDRCAFECEFGGVLEGGLDYSGLRADRVVCGRGQIGTLFGAIVGRYFSDYLGRRKAIAIFCVMFSVGVLIQGERERVAPPRVWSFGK
jgi:hypothetical protein